MNTDSGKTNDSHFKKITVVISIIVSVLSLGFGVYQYFDKRGLEKELARLKIGETLMKNKADISIQYLETDLESITTHVEHGVSFDEACLRWLDHLGKTSFFGVTYKILENPVYREIKDYRGNTQDHFITFFLINNTGGSKAIKMLTNFRRVLDRQSEDYIVEVDQLVPGEGVMFPMDHFDKEKHYGARLLPKDYRLEYFDQYLKKEQEITIRRKLHSPRIIAPKVRLLR